MCIRDRYKLAEFIKRQSGAQFPVQGVVYEDMYTKNFYEPYIFKDGVTVYVAAVSYTHLDVYKRQGR